MGSDRGTESTTDIKHLDQFDTLKLAHEAADYNSWFCAQVQASRDDPRPSIPSEEVKAHFAKKRAALRERIAKEHA